MELQSLRPQKMNGLTHTMALLIRRLHFQLYDLKKGMFNTIKKISIKNLRLKEGSYRIRLKLENKWGIILTIFFINQLNLLFIC